MHKHLSTVLLIALLTSHIRAEDATASREELVKKLKEALPKGWTAAINPQAITGGDSPDDIAVWREEKTPMRRAGLPSTSGLDPLPEAKPGYMYFKLLSADKFMPVDEYQRLKKANDERLKTIKSFHERLKGVKFAAKVSIENFGPQYFDPETKEQKDIIAEFKTFWDKTPKHNLPDLHFKNLTLYFEDLREWEIPTTDQVNDDANQVAKVIQSIPTKYE